MKKVKNTIKSYREMKTDSLKTLLHSYETMQFNTDSLISKSIDSDNNIVELEKRMSDYDIDVSLIRMELNKRLWKEST